LGVKDSSGSEIHRARETIRLIASIAPVNIEETTDHIAGAGIILRAHDAEFNIPRVEPLRCLLADRVLTRAHGVILRERPSVPTVWTSPVIVSLTGSLIRSVAVLRNRIIATVTPLDLERVIPGSAVRVLNFHHGCSAIPWIAD
jgi:hypothetical protein